MIEKGIQDSEEAGILLENSLAGADWGTQEEAEEAQWKFSRQRRREEEAALREKERELAREQRRCQDNERRRRQMEELERELAQERHQETTSAEEQRCRSDACVREFNAATQIQAHQRGRQSR